MKTSMGFPMRLRFCLLSLVTMGMSMLSPAYAGAIDQLHQFAKETRSARGSFVQQVSSRARRATPPSSGEFIFERPGKFRWAYLKPYEQIIVADGKTLSIYDKDLKQATVRKLDEALGATPAAILFGATDLEQRFTLKEAGTRDGIEWLEAVPKNKDTAFERIAVGFRSGGNGELAGMELKDALGQSTTLSFAGVERNVRIGAEAFRLDLPKGVDVLRN